MRFMTDAGSQQNCARQCMVTTTLILAKKQAVMGSARVGVLRW